MSYHLCYLLDSSDKPAEGAHLATGKGWLSFLEWAEAHEADYPCAAHLGTEGTLEPAGAIDALEEELTEIADHADADENVAGVAVALLAAVRDRPDDTIGLIVSDGTSG